jgi:uncharacterized membrane protein
MRKLAVKKHALAAFTASFTIADISMKTVASFWISPHRLHRKTASIATGRLT